MNAYPIGNDLTVKWSLLYSDGSVFPLSNYDYELSYRTNRGNKVVTDTSVISVDENILTWTFKGDEQVVSGRYTICLKITLSGSKVVELQYDNAFMLSPLSGFKGAGSEIVLQSYCDAIDLKDAVLQARKAMDIAANALVDTANSARDAKAAKAAAEVTAAQAKADAESAKTMAADAKDKVAVAEKAATDASRDAVAAQRAAQTASDHITSLQQAIAELPDGQAVTEKVAEHTIKLAELDYYLLGQRKEVNYVVGTTLKEYAFDVNVGDVIYLTTSASAPYAAFVNVYNGATIVQSEYTYAAVTKKEITITTAGKAYLEIGNNNPNAITAILEGVEGELPNIKKSIIESSESILESLKEKVTGIVSHNLFDKNAVIPGYYVVPRNGTLSPAAGYNASDFIPIVAGETYSATMISNAAFYKADKTYLSAGGSSATFTAPASASFIRLTITNGALPTFMFNQGSSLMPYESFGTKLSIDSFTDNLLEQLKKRFSVGDIDESYLYHLRESLYNPFIRTSVKLVGDSITAGMGGTGFSATGETIPGSTTKANVLTATCWANMLYHYLDSFNRDCKVDFSNNHLVGVNRGLVSQINMSGSGKNEGSMAIFYYSPNSESVACTFSFFGDHFGIRYRVGTNFGKFAVYVDGVLAETIDCYAADNDYPIHNFTNLMKTTHSVEIRILGTKSTSSSATNVFLCALLIPKKVECYNYGISGSTSGSSLVSDRYNDGDFVIIQYGTNDRITLYSIDELRYHLLELADMVKNAGGEPIFMCSCPAAESQETDTASTNYYFHMRDVHDMVAKVASELHMPFIDNYSAFIEYADQHDVEFTTLLDNGGLHPNDDGYKVMFINIMKCLGLARQPYYWEWQHS